MTFSFPIEFAESPPSGLRLREMLPQIVSAFCAADGIGQSILKPPSHGAATGVRRWAGAPQMVSGC
jgi:hypothetical protein